MSKNANKEKALQSHLQKIEEGVRERTRPKSFMEKNYKLRRFIMIVSIPVIAYSLFTGGIFLFSYFSKTFNNDFAAFLTASMLVMTVEAIYYWFTYASAKDVADGDYKAPGNYTTLFWLKVTLALIAGACSVTWSIKGAPEIADFMTRQRSPIELIDEQPINERYDALIAKEEKVIALGSEMTWRNKVVQDGREAIKQATTNKETYELARARELSEVRAKNQTTTLRYESGIEKRGNWYLGFAGGGQLLGFLIIVFLIIYDEGAKAELPDLDEEAQKVDPSHFDNPVKGSSVSHLTTGAQAPAAKRQIGFDLSGLGDKVPDNPEAKTSLNQVDSTRVENYPKPMSGQGSPKLEQPVSTRVENQNPNQVGKVVLIGKNLVFEHVTEEGEIKQYDQTSVNGRFKKYLRQVQESEARLAKSIKKNDTRLISIHTKSLENRKRWKEYWETALGMFN